MHGTQNIKFALPPYSESCTLKIDEEGLFKAPVVVQQTKRHYTLKESNVHI
jgi:hypothetical protein